MKHKSDKSECYSEPCCPSTNSPSMHVYNFDNTNMIPNSKITLWKRVAFSLSSLIFFACGLASCYSQGGALQLKVLSYNIHYGVGMDGKKDLDRIAELINTLHPDIVGLQEVSDSAMVDALAQKTSMLGVFGASTEEEPPNLYHLLDIPVPAAQLHYGDGILSRYPFQYNGNISLPSASSSRYEAMCIDVDITKEGGKEHKVRFITTHFDYLKTIGSTMAREASVDVIEEAFIDDTAGFAYILTGDLNAPPNSTVLKRLEQKGWMQEDFGKELLTIPSVSPVKQIDYVLVRPKTKWRIIDVRVIEEEMASDHRPILMTLERTSDK